MGFERDRGFTFIEVLIALALLIGLILIAWNKFNRSFEETMEATLVSDLRNLATAQEVYYRNHLTYTTDLDQLQINPSAKSDIVITSADRVGWAAWNGMVGTPVRCEVFVGDGHSAPFGFAASAEQIACDNP